jgi:hypothetical protein
MHDTTVDEGNIGLETTQSSTEDGSKEWPLRRQRVFARYRIFVHLFIWLVMTGSVPLLMLFARFWSTDSHHPDGGLLALSSIAMIWGGSFPSSYG